MRLRYRPSVRLQTLKTVAHRFSFALLLVTALALTMVGKVDHLMVDAVRARVMDVAIPLLDGLSQPAATIAEMAEDVRELSELRRANEILRQQNLVLQQYQIAARRLEAENLSLRQLLNYQPAGHYRYIGARVVADNSGAYVRSLAVNVGRANGVGNGQAVLGGAGLAGRIVQAGERSARILLITDLNARIPVIMEASRTRAILGGDNSNRPRLEHLPPETAVRIGERIVTSGTGGLFPPGLPVGEIAEVTPGGDVRVRPIEDLSRLEQVRIVDFQLSREVVPMVATPGFNR